jgi:HEAT repeat protein
MRGPQLAPAVPPLRDLSDYAQLLIDLLGVEDVGVRCLVAAHVGEIGLRELIPALEALPSDPAGFVSEAVAKAMARLRDPEGAPR